MQRSRLKQFFAQGEGSARLLEYAVVGAAFVLLAAAFALLPLPGADDWMVFHGAAQHAFSGKPLYGQAYADFGYFYNPPWTALMIIPFGWLPFRWGLGLMVAVSLWILFLLCRQWGMSPVKLSAVLLSPPVFYTILHGNLDILVLGVLLLPKEFWLIASLCKPQTTIGLVLGSLQSNLWKAVLIAVATVLITFILFGNWVPAYISQPLEMIGGGHNLFLHTWPYQIVVGVALAYIGWKRKDALYLIGASPFFSPYAATSTMLGPLLLLIARRKDWQAVAIVAGYWALSLWSGGAFR